MVTKAKGEEHMTGYDIAIFLIGCAAIAGYLYGYSAGAKFTLEKMNEKLDEMNKEKSSG
jgi:hypothetical protein